jgi:hypothetical protein
MKEINFIITSVIYFDDKPLIGGQPRSHFSFLERAEQTLKTINSIRQKVPRAKIILVELGLKKSLPLSLENKVDSYLYLGEKKIIRFACDGKNKSLGEAVALIIAKNKLPRTDFYFKISGRYFLNDNFNLSDWESDDKMLVKFYSYNFSTRLYGFSKNFLNIWFFCLLKSLPYLILGYSIEDVMYKFLKNRIKKIDTIGLSGFVAPNGTFLEE